MAVEDTVEAAVAAAIEKFRTTDIVYHPYTTGAADQYGQRTKSFGTSVTLIGRAIIRPTSQQITVIGDGQIYDIAFLFSRVELRNKFPSADEGEWLDESCEMSWFGRRYEIERIHPTGQVGRNFLLVVALGHTIEGQRD